MPVCLICSVALDEMNCCPICHRSYTRPFITEIDPPEDDGKPE